MANPLSQSFVAARIPRVRHFLHDEKFHLLLEIERTAEVECARTGRSDSLSKVREIGTANRQRRAGHDGGAIVPKQHSLQHRRDVDWRSIQRKKSGGFSGLFDPIDMTVGALL